MRITAWEAWRLEMPLSQPYDLAYGRIERAVNLVLVLETSSGLTGLGLAAPETAVTGETPEGVLALLRDLVGPTLKGRDPLRPAHALERLRQAGLVDSPAALAAADLALWDLVGKASGQPLWRLYGGFRKQIATSVTIGILDEAATLAEARERVAQGFKSLKLKGGADPALDAERVLAVRAAVGPRVELRFDANQGYSANQALDFVAQTRSAGLAILEQPTAGPRLELLARVKQGSTVPIMADESLLGLRDAFRLARRGLADMVNLKLMKTGGLAEAGAALSVARAARLPVMVGCMDESALGIAAGLALALGRPGVAYADLDGHLGLGGDPYAGAVTLKDGVLYPSQLPGLGVATP